MKDGEAYLTWEELKERGWSRLLMLACFGEPDICMSRAYGQNPLELFKEKSVIFFENDTETAEFFETYSKLVAMATQRKLYSDELASSSFCDSFELLIDKSGIDSVRENARTEYDRRMFNETGDEFHPEGGYWSDAISAEDLDRVAVLMLKNSSNMNTALSHLDNIRHGLTELGIPNEAYMSCINTLSDKFYLKVVEEYPELESAALEMKNSETLDAYSKFDINRTKSIFS